MMKSKAGSRKRTMRRGFMCNSTADTVVCMTDDSHRSAIVPRRPRNTRALIDDPSTTRLIATGSTPHSNKSDPFNIDDRDLNGHDHAVIRKETTHDHQEQKPSPLQSLSDNNAFQVVVMRVSIHCQGCAGKVKKHLSKMEGVTSFSIDLETKMVTVMGHVSPVGVLESVSKVKRAELWPC